MQAIWTQGLDEKEAADFKALLRNNTRFTNQFLKILHNKFETIERKGFKEDDYKDAGWMAVQAFNNGRLSTLREIAEMFNFRPESK